MNQRARARKSGSPSHSEWSSSTAAKIGSSPTIERARSGQRRAVGHAQAVVVEAVRLVPELAHGERDRGEVLEELERHALVRVVAVGEPERHLEHVEAELAHPGGAVGLLEHAAAGEHRRAVEGADVVEPEEAALEDVVAERVLAVHPPGEVDQQLVEGGGEELEVGAAVDAEHRERRPRLDGRVHVAEVPLVGGQLAVRVHVPLAAHEQQLVLRRGGIGVREDDAVEREVPRRVPGVLPLVGHREDVVVVQVPPAGVAPGLPRRRRRRLGRIAVEPAGDVVVIELLAPDHAGERLAHDRGLVVGRARRAERGVVLVGLARAVGERAIEARAEVERGALILPREPQPQLDGGARRDGEAIPARHLRAPALGVHRRRAADDVIVDAVLRVRRLRRRPEQARGVRLVLAEEELRRRAGRDRARRRAASGRAAPPRRARSPRCPRRRGSRAGRCPPPTTSGCGTTASAARAARRPRGRRCGRESARTRRTASPSRSRRRSASSGRRRRRRCRRARTRGRPASGARSPRAGARTGTRPADSGSASAATTTVGVASAYHQYSFASSPWFPSGPARPKMRSFRNGSRPFQKRKREAHALVEVADARRGRPRSSGRRASGRARTGSTPRPCRPRCSPRGPSPRRARSRKGRSPSTRPAVRPARTRCGRARRCARATPLPRGGARGLPRRRQLDLPASHLLAELDELVGDRLRGVLDVALRRAFRQHELRRDDVRIARHRPAGKPARIGDVPNTRNDSVGFAARSLTPTCTSMSVLPLPKPMTARRSVFPVSISVKTPRTSQPSGGSARPARQPLGGNAGGVQVLHERGRHLVDDPPRVRGRILAGQLLEETRPAEESRRGSVASTSSAKSCT